MPGTTQVSSATTVHGAAFSCRCSGSGADGVASVAVAGELDVATLAEFEQALRTVEADARLVVLDLRDLEFLSSSGGHAMVAAAGRVREAGGRFLVVRGPAEVDRFFQLTRLDSVLELIDEPPVLARCA